MTFTLTLLLATFTGNSVDRTVVDRVDLIEVNHYYDNGRHVLDQTIFYEWNEYDKRFQIRDWRPLKRDAQFPHYDWRRGEYVTRWFDGGVMREVRSTAFRETWTRYDPEFVERNILPKTARRLLSSSQHYPTVSEPTRTR
ncbi:MAG: hypothetical protein VB878_18255 [Pirellulaceae bacterium]